MKILSFVLSAATVLLVAAQAESPAAEEIALLPQDAKCMGPVYSQANNAIEYWTGKGQSVAWDISNVPQGRYNVAIEYGARDAGGEFEIVVGEARTKERLRPTGDFHRYELQRCGGIEISKGAATLSLVATKVPPVGFLMDLKKVILRPRQNP